ncbi:Tyrosine-protein kinase [Trema orientale]|uniref:Tyrosine-protein kinase n=1 Tax=Trema orientale TaxID=63057 RepID=A0A2P5FH19_TREOI|nr:Tyrosine-protein kinase [Trema orientale]
MNQKSYTKEMQCLQLEPLNSTTSTTYVVPVESSQPSLYVFGMPTPKTSPTSLLVSHSRFSAATSHLVERHVLQSWEFSSSLVVKEKSSQKGRLIIGLTVSGAVLVAGVVLIMTFVVLRKRKQKNKGVAETENLTSMNYDLERGAGVPRRFSYNDLASATNNFSGEGKLGEGGFGAVYRGYLRDLDMVVAVKKISRGSKQGKKEYITEVKVISSLRHRNLV